MSDDCNIAAALPARAAADPDRTAVVFRRGGRARSLDYAALDALADRYAHAVTGAGVERGTRVLVMVRPGFDLVALVFALLKAGAVPVLVDPGLPRRDFLACVRDAAPGAFVGIPLAHLVRILFPGAFRSVRTSLSIQGPWPLAARLERLAARAPGPFPVAATAATDEAAIAFTSGSTGEPKGVVYRHATFRAQLDALRDALGILPGGVHLACVHIFALFDPALGCTTVFPDMDPTRTAAVDGAELADAIRAHGVTFGLGSPTIWRRLAEHCERTGATLPGPARVFMFGAPVPPSLVERTRAIIPGVEIYTPYGATEGLPLTLIEGAEILAEAARGARAGVCVGRPIAGVDVAIIPVSDAPIAAWSADLALPAGEVGEIAVRGEVMTREYVNRPDLTAMSKIADGDRPWHRMGDLGYLDERGRVWFCGRKSHRVDTAHGRLLPVPCEAVFNAHPAVLRTALVGVGARGAQVPVLVVEPRPGHADARSRERLVRELLELGAAHPHTRDVRTVLLHAGFPMDVRHNAKIRREVLAQWAEATLR